MIKNKKAQIGLIDIDASSLPKWILYPLLIIIAIILIVVTIVMILFIVSWFKGDTQFMPFGMFGYYGFPIMIGGGISIHDQQCFVNGVEINCTDFPTNDYEHFCNNGKCNMNGVCPATNSNKSIEECIKDII